MSFLTDNVHDQLIAKDKDLIARWQKSDAEGRAQLRTLVTRHFHSLNNEAHASRQQGDRRGALRLYTFLAEFCRAFGNRVGEVGALTNLGSTYFGMKRHKEALSTLKQVLKLYRELGDRLGEAHTLTGIASIHKELRHWDEAMGFYLLALPLLHEEGDTLTEEVTLSILGEVYLALKRYDNAVGVFTKALRLNKNGVESWMGLGTALEKLGELDKAIEAYRQANKRDLKYQPPREALARLGATA